MEKKIMYDSDEAAQRVTVSGWMSGNGTFWPDKTDPKFAEYHARWGGCTHLVCDCGKEYEKNYTMCQSCRSKKLDERYQSMPFKEWEGEPLCLYRDDTYFFDIDSLIDWAEEHEIEDLSTIQLVICTQNLAWEINGDEYYYDELPEDTGLSDVAPMLAEALEGVNKVIREKQEILSWSAGKFRTTINKMQKGGE